MLISGRGRVGKHLQTPSSVSWQLPIRYRTLLCSCFVLLSLVLIKLACLRWQGPWCDSWPLESCDHSRHSKCGTKAIVENPEYPLRDDRLIIDVVKKGVDLHQPISLDISNHQSPRFGYVGEHLFGRKEGNNQRLTDGRWLRHPT